MFKYLDRRIKLRKICKACNIETLYPAVEAYALRKTDCLPDHDVRANGKTTAVFLRLLLDLDKPISFEDVLKVLRSDPDFRAWPAPLRRYTAARFYRVYFAAVFGGVKLPPIAFGSKSFLDAAARAGDVSG